MKLNVEINNITQSPVADSFFVAAVRETFSQLDHDFFKDKNISISIALVAPEEIRKLNKEYRKYDSVTDILSFPEYGSIGEIKVEEKSEIFLGELILCYNDINEYAKRRECPPAGGLEKELAEVVSHGVLHLLGFEHGEKMFEIQKKVAEKIIKKMIVPQIYKSTTNLQM